MSETVKILIVDDHDGLRKAYVKLIEVFLPEATIIGECSDGADVIPFLNTNEVHVILMDVRMSGLNGFETTKKVKDCFPRVKIIGLSNEFDQITHDAMKAAGASYFFAKSVDPEILMESILS